VQAARALDGVIGKLRAGQRQTLVIGVGHGMCTCEGAAFEYTFNVEHELRTRGLRDLADVIYLSNEYELGDFGVGGMVFRQQGFLSSSQIWTESLFRERGVKAILRAHVERVEPGKIYYETLDGARDALSFDFAMLLPPFRGADLKAYDRAAGDITADLFAPSGFLKVDADYTPKPDGQWRAADWPQTYQSPRYANMFGIGIAFAPPHPISTPRSSPNGTVISPAPPRTGMPSAVMGRQVARSIARMIRHGTTKPAHTASMAAMGAACIASAGAGIRDGTAAAMTMYPVVPDYARFPVHGHLRKTPTARSAWRRTGSSTCSTSCSSTRPRHARAGHSCPNEAPARAAQASPAPVPATIDPTRTWRPFHGRHQRPDRCSTAADHPHPAQAPLNPAANMALRPDQPAHAPHGPQGLLTASPSRPVITFRAMPHQEPASAEGSTRGERGDGQLRRDGRGVRSPAT